MVNNFFFTLILCRVLTLSYTKTLSCGCNYYTNNVLSYYLFALLPLAFDHFQSGVRGKAGEQDYLRSVHVLLLLRLNLVKIAITAHTGGGGCGRQEGW